MSKLEKIACITGYFGIKGQVKIYSEVDDFFSFKDKLQDKNGNKINIISCKKHKNDVWIANIDGVLSCNDAEKMKSMEIFVRQEDFPKLKDGEFYEFQIIGFDVFEDKNEICLGKVIEFMHFNSSKVCIVELNDKNFSRGNIQNNKLYVHSMDIISIQNSNILIKKIPEIFEY